MTTRNSITGDKIASKQNSDKFRSGWDTIWGDDNDKKEQEPTEKKEDKDESDSQVDK